MLWALLQKLLIDLRQGRVCVCVCVHAVCVCACSVCARACSVCAFVCVHFVCVCVCLRACIFSSDLPRSPTIPTIKTGGLYIFCLALKKS